MEEAWKLTKRQKKEGWRYVDGGNEWGRRQILRKGRKTGNRDKATRTGRNWKIYISVIANPGFIFFKYF